ncbi:hypothetical protein SAMN05443574_102314 [Haloarcula vallismortis]|uniref:Uncharacterized protein n=2 Tax=Haloarcula vallismortis TaxID=28442 RepID=M0JGM3_HALVA|nr:hypothetical protein [Haloarcula vallismortis]EMA08131.1 hypothetical protein C437_08519 [Haloarcula vallismortis ATCC 29715]SDW29629.1 hypothetical protein SAMN05443574_102314 [Haloarcula vallismortis]
MAQSDTDTELSAGTPDAVDRLEQAAEAYDRAQARVEEIGADALRDCREVYSELRNLLESYDGRATGGGDFEAFMEFQGRVGTLTDDLPEDLPERDTFEEIDDFLQQRRLTEGDFEQAREMLSPIGDLVGRLDELDDAREQYKKARTTAGRRHDELGDRIDDLERLRRLGDADLDAPVARLRDPIERYNDAVTEAFTEFRRNTPARDALAVIDRADAYPLVEFRSPPADLLTYVCEHDAGTEPVPKLLEYADYSASKLDHYVDDAAALRSAVATRQTYLRRLDAEPVRVDWPPPSADALPWYCREYRSVVARFADESVVATLREVRGLADREDYERLRESAVARSELTESERERLASGAVEQELSAAREASAAIEDALDAHSSL